MLLTHKEMTPMMGFILQTRPVYYLRIDGKNKPNSLMGCIINL
jgi:hypothetical protein